MVLSCFMQIPEAENGGRYLETIYAKCSITVLYDRFKFLKAVG